MPPNGLHACTGTRSLPVLLEMMPLNGLHACTGTRSLPVLLELMPPNGLHACTGTKSLFVLLDMVAWADCLKQTHMCRRCLLLFQQSEEWQAKPASDLLDSRMH